MKTIDAMYSHSLLDNINFWITTLLLVCFIINIHLCKYVQFAEIDIFILFYISVYISSFADRIVGLSWFQTEGGWDESLYYNGVSTQDSKVANFRRAHKALGYPRFR